MRSHLFITSPFNSKTNVIHHGRLGVETEIQDKFFIFFLSLIFYPFIIIMIYNKILKFIYT